MFPSKNRNPYYDAQINAATAKERRTDAYLFLQEKFENKTLDDVLDFRNQMLVVADREIPEDLKDASKKKKLFLKLNDDTDRGLSGYNIFL